MRTGALVRLRLAALEGNRAHAPRSSLAAFTSAYTSGAWLLGLEVRASKQGEPFVAHRAEVAGLSSDEVRELDLGADFRVEGGEERPWAHARPLARVQSLGALLDALPDQVELLLSVPADVAGGRELGEKVVDLVRRRGLEQRVWLLVGAGDPAAFRDAGVRVAARLEGAGLQSWLTSAEPAARLVIAPQAALVQGASGSRTLRLARSAINGPLVVALEDALADKDLREIAGLLEGTADALSSSSTLRLADTLRQRRALQKSSFAGEQEDPGRIRFGYAKANPYAHVFQRDGVHVELRPYDGRAVFGDEADPVQAKLSALEERLHYALKDWPFYSGGGLGTTFPIDEDFSAEVDFEWKVASQATMLEMAVVNVDPPTHHPGWRAGESGSREPNTPLSFRDKNAFFDPHGAPPFVGVERDEDDGFRINWNLGSDYDNNQYARPHGNGKSMRGRLRLDRAGAWFSAYYRDDGNPDWVCLGSCRNESMNRRVYLRCATKRWRQERPDGPGFMPIPENSVVFRNLTIHTVLPMPRGPHDAPAR